MENESLYFEHNFSFTQEQVDSFAALSGDNNPIHLDQAYAEKSIFGRRILHGYLGTSVFSKVFGTLFPGHGTIYLKQSLVFLRPMYADEIYTATFQVVEVFKEKSRALVKTSIVDYNKQEIVVGEALVQHDVYGK